MPAAALIAVLMSGPAALAGASDADEIRELRAQIDLLNERLRALEQRAGLTEPTVSPAEPAPAVAAAEPEPALDWARGLSLGGDLRVRHEHLERDGLPDRERQRVRARLAVNAEITETVDATVGFATGGDDPRSANQTLGANFTRKSLGLDLAYFDWHPLEGLNVYGGKMKYVAFKPAMTTFIDGDLNPEGFAVAWQSESGLFATASSYWIEERALTVDSMWWIGQLGWRGSIGDGISLAAVASYHDFANVQGQKPFYLLQSFGNSTDADGALLYDYDIAKLAFEVGFGLGTLPVRLFGEYGQNVAVDDLDTAWSLGFLVGKASKPGSWEFGYLYGDTEKDALFAQVIESDFADGRTDSRGHALRAGYAIAKNWTANLQIYLNDLNVSGETTIGFDRLQLDLNFKY
ncbi:MAG TPA: putative porin [Steroidobacteraceae bacterium]|nr:putative porin [Steroidobacteraceae bacterium]